MRAISQWEALALGRQRDTSQEISMAEVQSAYRRSAREYADKTADYGQVFLRLEAMFLAVRRQLAEGGFISLPFEEVDEARKANTERVVQALADLRQQNEELRAEINRLSARSPAL